LGDIDAWRETEAGVLFAQDTFVKPGSGLVLPYVAVDAGYGDNTDQDIQIIDAVYKSGSKWLWEYGTTKDIETGSILSVTVKNHAGDAVAGASVQIFDAAGQLVFSGTTDASGQVADIPVSLTEFQQLTRDPSNITSKALGPFR
jgi:hypothetical protein